MGKSLFYPMRGHIRPTARRLLRPLSVGLMAAGLMACATREPAAAVPFEAWKETMKAEAVAAGIAPAVVAAALNPATVQPRALELDSRQPEFNLTFGGYFKNAVPDSRIALGREMYAKNKALFDQIGAQWGVQPRFLVAFWGLETNFGNNLGGFNVIDTLATLAWDGRRAAFFKAQLLDALRIIQDGHVTRDAMIGSWAGAMGQMQFMPSTFRAHAADGDGNGHINVWTSLPDALSSAARYLHDLEWKHDQTWGREVRLPRPFDYGRTGVNNRLPLSDWAKMGVTRTDGGPLPTPDGMTGAIILPAGHQGPAFLVYDNYFSILHWNRSQLYALAVGHLADRIAGEGPLVAAAPANDRPLRTSEVEEIQTLLNGLGHDAGTPDGMVGSQTREAIRSFQTAAGLPADGYANAALLDRLRAAGR